VIKSVKIKSAGPLKDLTIDFKKANLIVGNNEEGKTTLMDILIQNTLRDPKNKKSAVKAIWNKRFDFNDCEVESDGKIEEDAASLLVVREGKTSWRGKENKTLDSSEYWNKDIKGLLYGKDDVYLKIDENINKVLGVSRENSWFKQFFTNIGNFKKELEQDEQELLSLIQTKENLGKNKIELNALEKSLQTMDRAREQQGRLRAQKAIEDYFNLLEKNRENEAVLERLLKKDYDKLIADYHKMEIRERALKEAVFVSKTEKENAEKNLSERKMRAEQIERELATKEETHRSLENEKNELENKRLLIVRQMESERERIQKSFETGKFTAALWISLSLFLFGAAFFVLQHLNLIAFIPASYFLVGQVVSASLSGLFLILFIVFLLLRGRESENKKRVRQAEENYQNQIASWNIQANNLKEKEKWFDSDVKRLKNELESLQKQIQSIENALKQNKLPELEREAMELKHELDGFVRQSGGLQDLVAEAEKKKNALQIRSDLQKRIRTLEQELEKHFKTSNKERLAIELEKLQKNGCTPSEYDEEQFQSLSRRKDDLMRAISKLKSDKARLETGILERFDSAKARLSAGMTNAKREYVESFYPEVFQWSLRKDAYNLIGFRERFDAFYQRLKKELEASKLIDRVLNEESRRADTMLREVLENDAFVQNWKKLSGGRYTGLRFELQRDKVAIQVTDNEGRSYGYETLSTGTRHQFDFALRLALAERLFKNGAVLLLDDAFLSFDLSRRRVAVELCRDYVRDRNWQLVYSTVNEGGMESLFDDVFKKELNKTRLS